MGRAFEALSAAARRDEIDASVKRIEETLALRRGELRVILDNQDLEAVAETAARLNRWEFLLTVAPVSVTGGTGFPANPLAIF